MLVRGLLPVVNCQLSVSLCGARTYVLSLLRWWGWFGGGFGGEVHEEVLGGEGGSGAGGAEVEAVGLEDAGLEIVLEIGAEDFLAEAPGEDGIVGRGKRLRSARRCCGASSRDCRRRSLRRRRW